MKTCLKCQYQRKPSDEAPAWQCPSCGVAYIKAEQARSDTAEARPRARPVAVTQEADGGSNLKMIAVGCVVLALAGFGLWKYKHRVHVSPEQANSESFDAAKKAFDETNYTAALKGFTPLAEAGNPKAQYYMGRIYAWSWSERPFDSDSPRHKGDPTKQIEWYTKAAEQGDLQSQLELSKLYEHGFGPNADRAPGLRWLQAAADQGDASAEYQIGVAYEKGSTHDYMQAMSWYRKSADQGYDAALVGLGSLYAWGHGVTKSNFIAYEYMGLAEAIDKGSQNTGTVFPGSDKAELSKQLTDREREEADQFVTNWKQGQSLPQ